MTAASEESEEQTPESVALRRTLTVRWLTAPVLTVVDAAAVADG